MDTFGQILWYVSFLIPFFAIPFAWRTFEANKFLRILMGIFMSVVLWIAIQMVVFSIAFRDGMGSS